MKAIRILGSLRQQLVALRGQLREGLLQGVAGLPPNALGLDDLVCHRDAILLGLLFVLLVLGLLGAGILLAV